MLKTRSKSRFPIVSRVVITIIIIVYGVWRTRVRRVAVKKDVFTNKYRSLRTYNDFRIGTVLDGTVKLSVRIFRYPDGAVQTLGNQVVFLVPTRPRRAFRSLSVHYHH